jgi:hypothetical protein
VRLVPFQLILVSPSTKARVLGSAKGAPASSKKQVGTAQAPPLVMALIISAQTCFEPQWISIRATSIRPAFHFRQGMASAVSAPGGRQTGLQPLGAVARSSYVGTAEPMP